MQNEQQPLNEEMNMESAEREHTTLGTLRPGHTGRVTELQGGRGFTTRMAALGFTHGSAITVIQNFGRGPIIVMVRGTRIALGRGEADHVWVSPNGDHHESAV
jgi:ferrous iron transport protein A